MSRKWERETISDPGIGKVELVLFDFWTFSNNFAL